MMNFLKSNRFILVLASLTVIVLIVYLFLRSPLNPPKLISSNPISGSDKIVLDQSITLNFDKEIDSTTLKVTSTPEENWDIENINKTSVIITHKLALLPYTDYQLVVTSNGKQLGTVSFTTMVSQSDPRLVQTIEEQMKIDYPLSQKLPYETNAYEAVYITPLTIEIRRKNDVLSDEEMINQVKSWVKDNGVDPDTHKYTVVTPSPTSSPNL